MGGNLSRGQRGTLRVPLHSLDNRLGPTAKRPSRLPCDEVLHQIDVVHASFGFGHVSQSCKPSKRRRVE